MNKYEEIKNYKKPKIQFINDSSVEGSYNLTIILFRWAKVASLLKDQAFFTYQST